MIIDSSALVAIATDETGAARLLAAVRRDHSRWVSAATYVETSIVIDARRNPVQSRYYDDLLLRMRVRIAPFTESQARLARQAYRDFGKGSGHPAQLNFGDCFAYALAKELDEPLLFKGDDFGHTDVRVVPVG